MKSPKILFTFADVSPIDLYVFSPKIRVLNCSKNGYLGEKNQTQIPSFWPIDVFLAGLITLKMTAPKIHLLVFNFKNVIKTLNDTPHLLYLEVQLK